MRVTLAQAAAAIERKARAIATEARRAERQAAREALAEARKLSSGPYSARALARLGHPYARRRPRPPLPASVINVQSGRFRAGWQVTGTGDRLVLVNASPAARWLTARGTRRMIGRPIAAAVAARIRERRLRRLRQAVRRGLAA